MASSLKLSRTSDKDIKMRELYVRVDEQPEHTLFFGQEITLDLEPGTYTIAVTNRLFTKRETVQIRAGESVTYRVGNIASGLFAALVALGGAGPYKVFLEAA